MIPTFVFAFSLTLALGGVAENTDALERRRSTLPDCTCSKFGRHVSSEQYGDQCYVEEYPCVALDGSIQNYQNGDTQHVKCNGWNGQKLVECDALPYPMKSSTGKCEYGLEPVIDVYDCMALAGIMGLPHGDPIGLNGQYQAPGGCFVHKNTQTVYRGPNWAVPEGKYMYHEGTNWSPSQGDSWAQPICKRVTSWEQVSKVSCEGNFLSIPTPNDLWHAEKQCAEDPECGGIHVPECNEVQNTIQLCKKMDQPPPYYGYDYSWNEESCVYVKPEETPTITTTYLGGEQTAQVANGAQVLLSETGYCPDGFNVVMEKEQCHTIAFDLLGLWETDEEEEVQQYSTGPFASYAHQSRPRGCYWKHHPDSTSRTGVYNNLSENYDLENDDGFRRAICIAQSPTCKVAGIDSDPMCNQYCQSRGFFDGFLEVNSEGTEVCRCRENVQSIAECPDMTDAGYNTGYQEPYMGLAWFPSYCNYDCASQEVGAHQCNSEWDWIHALQDGGASCTAYCQDQGYNSGLSFGGPVDYMCKCYMSVSVDELTEENYIDVCPTMENGDPLTGYSNFGVSNCEYACSYDATFMPTTFPTPAPTHECVQYENMCNDNGFGPSGLIMYTDEEGCADACRAMSQCTFYEFFMTEEGGVCTLESCEPGPDGNCEDWAECTEPIPVKSVVCPDFAVSGGSSVILEVSTTMCCMTETECEASGGSVSQVFNDHCWPSGGDACVPLQIDAICIPTAEDDRRRRLLGADKEWDVTYNIVTPSTEAASALAAEFEEPSTVEEIVSELEEQLGTTLEFETPTTNVLTPPSAPEVDFIPIGFDTKEGCCTRRTPLQKPIKGCGPTCCEMKCLLDEECKGYELRTRQKKSKSVEHCVLLSKLGKKARPGCGMNKKHQVMCGTKLEN